eukprot:1758395-Pleurochrysis_carterae.AAC.1
MTSSYDVMEWANFPSSVAALTPDLVWSLVTRTSLGSNTPSYRVLGILQPKFSASPAAGPPLEGRWRPQGATRSLS